MKINHTINKTNGTNRTLILIGDNELHISNNAGLKIFKNKNFKNISAELIAILGAGIQKALGISEANALETGEIIINRWGI